MITTRYVGQKLEDIFLGKPITVNISVVRDAKILDTGHFDMTQVDYIWIGTISLAEPGDTEI